MMDLLFQELRTSEAIQSDSHPRSAETTYQGEVQS